MNVGLKILAIFSGFIFSSLLLADAAPFHGVEQIDFQSSKTGITCFSSVVLSIDYSQLKLNIKEIKASGECSEFNPDGTTYRIRDLKVSENNGVVDGLLETIQADRNFGSEVVKFTDSRGVKSLRPGSEMLRLTLQTPDRVSLWDVKK